MSSYAKKVLRDVYNEQHLVTYLFLYLAMEFYKLK